jgi:hypothetical protein
MSVLQRMMVWVWHNSKQCDSSCETNMLRVTNSPEKLVWYCVSTRKADVMIFDDEPSPNEYNHSGGLEAIVQAYRQFAIFLLSGRK